MKIRIYRKWIVLVAVLLGCASFSLIGGPDATLEPQDSPYTLGKPGKDGIGKFYLGREISHVMGHRGASWLERPERLQEELPDRAVLEMELKSTDVVADIGAGTGYFSFRMSRYVKDGMVMAVDIQQEMLDIIADKMKNRSLSNIKPILGKIDDPNLPANSIDVALMVDAYHEFSHPVEMMTALVNALRPGGRIILIEYRLEDPDVPIKRLHKMSVKQASKEMKAVGLEFIENRNFLPQQHFLIYRKPLKGENFQG